MIRKIILLYSLLVINKTLHAPQLVARRTASSATVATTTDPKKAPQPAVTSPSTASSTKVATTTTDLKNASQPVVTRPSTAQLVTTAVVTDSKKTGSSASALTGVKWKGKGGFPSATKSGSGNTLTKKRASYT